MMTRRLLKYLASLDLLYGVCILLQILVLSISEQSYHPSSRNNDSENLADFLSNNRSVELQANFSKSFGQLRAGLIRALIFFTLLITIVRFIFTVFPLQSMRLTCSISSCCFHTVSIFIVIFAILSRFKYNSKTLSACMGLLICENYTSFTCANVPSRSVVQSVISLFVCSVILVLIGIIWTIANKKDRLMKNFLKIEACYQSKNFKAVKTSLAISTVFLICNSGPMANNVVKIFCGTSTPDPCTMQLAYNIADVCEQWLLPIMTVSNCVIYTATNRKIKKFVVWYYRRQIRKMSVWWTGRRRKNEINYTAVGSQKVFVRVVHNHKPSILGRYQFYDNSL